jgi:MFS family permease
MFVQTVPSAPLTKLNPMEARAGEIMDGSKDDDEEKPMSLRDLLTRPVVISVANYGLIGLLEMIAGVLIPLVWSTAVEFGGLSMSPASIGLWMAGYGLLNGVFQFVAFPPIVERFGPRRVFIVSISAFAPMYLMLFFENLTLRHVYGGASLTVLLIVLQLSSIAIADMGFSKFSDEPYGI